MGALDNLRTVPLPPRMLALPKDSRGYAVPPDYLAQALPHIPGGLPDDIVNIVIAAAGKQVQPAVA